MSRDALGAFFRRAALTFPLALGGCDGPIVCEPNTYDGGHAVVLDGSLPDAIELDACRQYCAQYVDVFVQSCAPGALDNLGYQQVFCTGVYPCGTGRRPAGLVARRSRSQREVGRFFAETAQLEAASVHAFRRLAAELRCHRAPEALIAGAQRSAREEIRHAKVTGALARRFGARPLAARVRPMPERPLLALAEENAAEGCVRETFGAAVAGWQSRAAGDAWARRRLSRADRRRLIEVRQNAALALAGELQQPPPSLVTVAGLPSLAAARALLSAAAPLFA